jgi:hypothetical protein
VKPVIGDRLKALDGEHLAMAVLVRQRGCEQPRVRRFAALRYTKEMDKRSGD